MGIMQGENSKVRGNTAALHFNRNKVAYFPLCINISPSFILVLTQLAGNSSCSVHGLNRSGASLKCMRPITFDLHAWKIEVTLSWAEVLYAEQFSFRACSWLKLLGPQAPKRPSCLKERTLVSKPSYFISTSLFFPLWQFPWEGCHFKGVICSCTFLSFCSWQHWTGGYSRDHMKEDPLLGSRNLGEVSSAKSRFCRAPDNLAP